MPDLKIELRCRKDENHGIYHSETKRAIINLGTHESLDDLFKTINHETFHHCFVEADEIDDMDEDQEERMIYCIQWAEFSLV